MKTIKVAISGKSGCGNTTVSGLLAKRLGVKLINYTFRTLAMERGVPLKAILDEAQKTSDIDKFVDKHQVDLANEGSCVLGSRLAIWMLKDADLKVYLEASDSARVKRIQEREGGALSDIQDQTEKRDAADTARYKALYGIDNNDMTAADLIIDTEQLSPAEIVDKIIARLKSLNKV